MAGKGGGGSWKVAYADFVTAMMALFLVLWITSQDQKVKEAIEHTFKHPFNPIKSVGIIPNSASHLGSKPNSGGGGQSEVPTDIEIQQLQRLNEDLLKVLETSPELANNNTLRLEFTADGLHISVLNRSQKPIFESGTAQLTEYGTWVFSTIAWEIARYRNCGLEIEGHTRQDTASPAKEDMWELTTARAHAARRHLVEHGVKPGQVSKVVGFGDRVPIRNSAPDDEINNRVTLLLSVRQEQPLELSSHYE